ncbi:MULTISPECIES: T7SS effector LXG polymorphic toxin, partial [Clostridia]|uniref:T7SS effector LXG polymorphic toxin n=1 Tax=Clostridia TaxID=186801 RepID=UPI000EA167F8
NAVLHSVKDIINVRDIDDGEFLDKVHHGKKMNRQTIEKLHAFDRHNTAKLDPIEQDIRTMKNYINQIRELGNNGKLRIGSYQARQLDDQKFHQELISGIKNKAVRNAIGLEAVLGEAGKLLLYSYTRFAAIPVQYLQKHFELKTMSYSYRAIHAVTAASGDHLTTGEFSTIEHQVVSKVKVSDYKKVRQGTYYTLTDGRIVRKFKSETGVNYELVDTIPADRHKPKEPEKSWVEKATDGIVKAGFYVGLAGYKTGKAGLKVSKEALDFVVLDDVNTVMDPKASTMDRVIAGASFVPVGKVFKLVKASGVIKFADKGKHTAKKVQGTGKLNKSLAKSYLRHIELKTGRKVHKGQTDLIKQALRNNKFEKLTPKQTAKHRGKFTSSLKDRLILEWEEKTNQKGPRYKEEVLDKNGEVIRSIGQPYDAHHIIENNFGGPHKWWNLHPAKYPDEHQAGIHGKGSPSGKLFPRR